jgi:transcriptional antiterminator RfaH
MQVSVPELAQGARWYLVHARPNSERKAELNLQATVRRPLFPRYLFVRLDLAQDRWFAVNSTVGVSCLFTQQGRPVAVPFGIVETLLAHSDADLTRLDRLLVEGQRVRIFSGPLADFTATAVRPDARRRVDVLLEIMGAAVSVSVDRRALAPAA